MRLPAGGNWFEARRHVPAETLERLAQAKPCCDSLAQLPYRALDREGEFSLDIDHQSPAFQFDAGKSYFAAFRLPEWPRPLEIRITSQALAPLAVRVIDSNRPVFSPALLILDARFRPKRMVQEGAGLTLKAYGRQTGGPELQVQGELYLSEPPEEAAYLVILTTDELRARKARSTDVTMEGFSPVGNVALEARSVPFVAPPVSYRGRAVLVDRERDGAAAGLFIFRPDTLLVSGNGVHYLAHAEGRYIERLRIPFESIVSARFVDRVFRESELQLLTAERPGAPTKRLAFALVPAREESIAALRRIEPIIAERIPTGWYAEPIALIAASNAPVVEFRDPQPASSPAGSRVADTAIKGGLITASVCGVCASGICPPELLLPCAGLFAVGAAVGGAVGIGGELLSGRFRESQAPAPLPADQMQAATPAFHGAAGSLGQAALRECVARQITARDPWAHQGRVATVQARADTARFILETAVHRVALVPRGQPGQSLADIPVQLVIEGAIALRDAALGREEQRAVSWEGPSYTLAEWSASASADIERAMLAACEGLAASMLRIAEPLWRAAQ